MNVRRKIKAAMSLSAATLALLQSNGEAKTKDAAVEKPATTTSSTNFVSQIEKLILTPGDARSDIEMVGRGGGHSSHSSHSSHYSGSPAHSSHYSTSPAHYSGSSSYSYSPPPATRPSVVQPVYPAAAPAPAYVTTVSPEEAEAKAVEFLKKQADAGNPAARYALAIRYLNGKGVEKSVEKAILLLKAAAAAGNESAKIKLIELLVDVGTSAETSTNAVAVTNLVITTHLVSAEEAARETEDAKTMYERAMKFLTGTDGETQDIPRAKLYLKMAADEGSKRATNVLKQLNDKIK